MKRSAVATIQRTARRGVTWRPKLAGREEMDIHALISPLRYDVLVRAEFYDFLEAHEELPRDQLLEAAREEPYRVWYEFVALRRFRPWALTEETVFESHFDERVLRSLAMLRSFRATGFDVRRPVTLRLVRGKAVTERGVQVAQRIHVGDGGHRLALLLRAGGVLHPKEYRVDRRAHPAVIDNTAILASQLHLQESTYARFISREYADRTFDTVAELQLHVAQENAGRLVELQQILESHGRTARLNA